MTKSNDRSVRQHWGPDSAKFTISQCGYCKNNKSAIECEVYGEKPADYLDNKKECPEREEEE